MQETQVRFLGQEDPLEEGMAIHSSILGIFLWCRIHLQCRTPEFDPWVGKIPWRRKWLPTSLFIPGEFHGQKGLMVYSPWGCKESDATECREPARAIPPMTRSCGRELLSKASGLKGLPRPARASTPKPESVYLTVLCISPTLLTLTGGYPDHLSLEKINLGL